MIRREKYANALVALNTLLVFARKMAYDRAAYEDIAAVLDIIEELPMLFLSSEDKTEYFRSVLEGYAGKYPGFALALSDFENEQ